MRSGRRSVEIGVIQNVERLAAQLSVWSRPDRRHTVAGAGIEFLAGPSSRIALKSKREQETCSRLPGDWYVRPYAMAGVVETGVFVSRNKMLSMANSPEPARNRLTVAASSINVYS